MRVLADANPEELRLLTELSGSKALIAKAALRQADKIADELLAKVSPRAWSKVEIGRTSLKARKIARNRDDR
jgi:hypothetical protein